MQYKLTVALRLGSRDCAPNSCLSAAQMLEAGMKQKHIDKMVARKQLVPLISENNPEALRTLHNVGPANMDAKSLLPAANSLQTTEEVVESATQDDEPKPKTEAAPKGVATAGKTEGLTEDLLADADTDAALVAVLERVKDESTEAVAAHVRASEDPRKEAVMYLCFNDADRIAYEQAVVEMATEKAAIAAMTQADEAPKPETPEAREDNVVAADARAAHENKLGADLHAQPKQE